MELVEFCPISHFQFNSKIYKQMKATPMRSPISGLIAEALMHRLEAIILPVIKPKFSIPYVDDTFVINKKDNIENTHSLINVSSDIKFIIKRKSKYQLPFLDVLVSRINAGKLDTQVYRKPTHTDQILNYNSNNPTTHKISCLQTLFRKVRTHCNTTNSRRDEQNYLISILKRNAYPRNFVRRCPSRTSSTTKSSTEISKRIILPYIKSISEITRRLLRPLDGIGVAHKSTNSFQTVVCKSEDTTTREDKRNIISKSTAITVVDTTLGEMVTLFTFVYMNTNRLFST
ncbi:unnamed protein product [Heterobilharzia americana]|nr:unnamed protein product [Heterobilharzia americana]